MSAPWQRAKEARRITDPSAEWAAEIRERVLAECHPTQGDAVDYPGRFFTWLVGRGGGKGLPLAEPVMTPSGERPIGSLKVGNRVCAIDGTLTHVIGVFPQGVRPTYEIEFDDGAIARCDDQHIWPIHVQGRDRDKVIGRDQVAFDGPGYRLMLMPEVLRRWQAGHRLHVPTMSRPAAMPWTNCPAKVMPIAPYLLGLLIGDASLRIGDVRFVSTDGQLMDEVLGSGFVEHTPDKRNGLRTARAPMACGAYSAIEALGLLGKRAWEKSIPGLYLKSTPEARLALLQGLMDTDGHVDIRSNTTFCSSSEQLARDVQWIVRSLGGKATMWCKQTKRRPAYTVYIQPGGKFNPFRLQRKADRVKAYQHAQLWRRVVAIRPIGEQETVCIKVDHPTGLFVTRDFVVTHNTTAFKARYVIEMAEAAPRWKKRFVYAAPTREMATDLLWDPLKDTCAKLNIEADFKEIGKTCTFRKTGARLKLVGADDKREMGKLRGQPFDGVGVDEVCEFSPEVLPWFADRIIIPRLGERRGWLGFASTPGHILRGLFYEATRPGSSLHLPYRKLAEQPDWDGWVSFAWDLSQVTALPDAERRFPAIVANWLEALRTKARMRWGDDNPVWMREYLGRWAADDTDLVFKYRPHNPDGTPHNAWNPPREGPMGLAKLPDTFSDWCHVIAMDEGQSDPFACNVFAFSPSDPACEWWHRYGMEQGKRRDPMETQPDKQDKMYARNIAKLLLGDDLSLDHPAGLIGALGAWPEAMELDGGESLVLELQNVYGLRVRRFDRTGKYKAPAIEVVNGDLVDGKAHILEGSPLAEQMGQLQWATDQYGNVRENKAQANHSTDCAVIARKAIGELITAGQVAPTPGAGRGGPPAGRPPQSSTAGAPPVRDDDSTRNPFAGMLVSPGYQDPWGGI